MQMQKRILTVWGGGGGGEKKNKYNYFISIKKITKI